MKHLSRDKLAKYHRFNYMPRFYKEDKEVFEHRVSEIKRQLDNDVAFEDVSSKVGTPKRKRISHKGLLALGAMVGFLAVILFMPIGVYTTALLFVFAFAFVKLSKK